MPYDDRTENKMSFFKDLSKAEMAALVAIVAILGIVAVAFFTHTPAPMPTPAPVHAEEPVEPPKSGCEIMPKLTNDQIIFETHKCESAGLDAEAFHCGDDPVTTQIQCSPRNHSTN